MIDEYEFVVHPGGLSKEFRGDGVREVALQILPPCCRSLNVLPARRIGNLRDVFGYYNRGARILEGGEYSPLHLITAEPEHVPRIVPDFRNDAQVQHPRPKEVIGTCNRGYGRTSFYSCPLQRRGSDSNAR